MLGEGMSELRVDQLGQCRPVGFVADVPGLQPGQLGVGQAGARLGHLGQPEVDRITEDCGQQQRPVFGLGPVLQVGEVAAEARPVVHVHQQFGDLDARQ
ncbi:Uncharacterised protein [Acinetobacter baumannii]|nr:Uncharacterised protein [Acinetobacter baumannii]